MESGMGSQYDDAPYGDGTIRYVVKNVLASARHALAGALYGIARLPAGVFRKFFRTR